MSRTGRHHIIVGALVGVLLVGPACSPDNNAGTGTGGTGTASVPEPPGEASETAPEDLASAFDRFRDEGFNGVVLVDDGGDIEVEGFGEADREAAIPNDGATVFDIGSITKQFTAAAILRLQTDGLLSVEDSVSDHLPELASGDKGEITLHQLLTHTAGLPDALGPDHEAISRADYLQLVAETPLLGPPGGEYVYSNVGYSVLAAVIETVTGGSYEEYLRAVLFEPAEMTSTGYVLPDWQSQVVAVGYEDGERVGRPFEANWLDDGPGWHLRGNGGVLSTAEDMHRWHEALVGDEILDPAAKEALYGRHTTEGPDASSYYGYGWAIFPTPWDGWLIAHNGGNGIFFADFLRFLDKDVTVFLATNDDETVEEDMALRLAGIVLGTELVPPSCRADDLTAFDTIDTFPDTDAGTAAAGLFDLIEGSDEAAARAFVEEHISDELAPGASPDDLIGALRGLQEEFAGLAVDQIVQEDQRTFHIRLTATSGDGEVIVSVRTGESEPRRISCIDIRG